MSILSSGGVTTGVVVPVEGVVDSVVLGSSGLLVLAVVSEGAFESVDAVVPVGSVVSGSLFPPQANIIIAITTTSNSAIIFFMISSINNKVLTIYVLLITII